MSRNGARDGGARRRRRRADPRRVRAPANRALALALIERGGAAHRRRPLHALGLPRPPRRDARPPRSPGMIELRGRGVIAVPHERGGVIRLVADIVERGGAGTDARSRTNYRPRCSASRFRASRSRPRPIERVRLVEAALARVDIAAAIGACDRREFRDYGGPSPQMAFFMIGLVLVTHGQLATEFRAALEHVVGHQEAFEAVSIGPEDDMEERRRDIVAAVDRVNDGSGVILLTDMFGGTPSNLAISVMEAGRVEVVAGVNLPMLIKLASVRADGDLDDGRLLRAGRRPQIHQRRQQASRPRMSAPASRQRHHRQPARPARPRLRPLRQMRRRLRLRGHASARTARASAAPRSWA